VGEIVVAVDTSGSIGRLDLERFAGGISAISEEAQPEAIHVVYCDAAGKTAAVNHLPTKGEMEKSARKSWSRRKLA
jgi:predicted metal-dependent peptidase